MLFEYDITVLTTHIATNKLWKVLPVDHGVIHHVAVIFPIGCAGMIHVTINRGLYQVMPVNPSGTLKGDNISVAGDHFIMFFDEPYELSVYAWGENCFYDHTVTIRLWQKRIWQLMPFSDEMFKLALKESGGMI